MADQTLDPALVGIWIVPGGQITYEVTADGGWHLAEPETPLAFEPQGRAMIWGTSRLIRTGGIGYKPVGTWHDPEFDERWAFFDDGTFMMADLSGGFEITGVWSLRNEGASLWARERRAEISTVGARTLTLRTPDGDLTYSYRLQDGVWRWFEPDTGAELVAYYDTEGLRAFLNSNAEAT